MEPNSRELVNTLSFYAESVASDIERYGHTTAQEMYERSYQNLMKYITKLEKEVQHYREWCQVDVTTHIWLPVTEDVLAEHQIRVDTLGMLFCPRCRSVKPSSAS